MGSLGSDLGQNGQTSKVTFDHLGNDVSFVLHNLPDVPSAPQVIGLCTVPADVAADDGLGYMISDFLAWKYMLSREGARDAQIWLSALDLARLEADGKIPPHTITTKEDGSRVGSDVSSSATEDPELLKTFNDASNLRDAFIEQLKARATTNTKTLLVFVCGETTPDQSICFDGNTFMSKDDILGHCSPDTLLILVSAASFSGGYQASYLNAPKAMFSQAQVIKLRARRCGGALASKLTHFLTSRDSPLLRDDERKRIAFDDLSLISNSSPEGWANFQRFHALIQASLSSQMTLLPKDHGFNWSEDVDEWPLEKRVGPPLKVWGSKWSGRAISPTSAQGDGFDFLGKAFGGTKLTQILHLKFLSMLELKTCPGDWTLPSNDATLKLLNSFLQARDIEEAKCREIFAVLQFRASAIALADVMIEILGLSKPGGQSCREWDFVADREMVKENPLKGKAQMLAFKMISHDLFQMPPVGPGLFYDKIHGFKFWRPSFYLASAIAHRFLSGGEDIFAVEHFIKTDVQKALDTVWKAQLSQLLQRSAIVKTGREWIESLDLDDATPRLPSEQDASARRPTGIEGSQHAPGRLPPTYAPYFGMVVQNGIKKLSSGSTGLNVAASAFSPQAPMIKAEAEHDSNVAANGPGESSSNAVPVKMEPQPSAIGVQHPAETEEARIERLVQERLALALAKYDQGNQAQEALAKDKLEKENLEKRRLAQEKTTREKMEQERLEQEILEREKRAQEKLMYEKLERQKREQARLEKERLEKEHLEKERLEKERLEKERLEKERLEKERLAAEEEARKQKIAEDEMVQQILAKFGTQGQLEQLIKRLSITEPTKEAAPAPITAGPSSSDVPEPADVDPDKANTDLREAWRIKVKERDPALDKERKERARAAEARAATLPKETCIIRPMSYDKRPEGENQPPPSAATGARLPERASQLTEATTSKVDSVPKPQEAPRRYEPHPSVW